MSVQTSENAIREVIYGADGPPEGCGRWGRDLAVAIEEKNITYLLSILAHGRDCNEKSKRAFEAVTGLKFGRTVKAIKSTLYTFVGFGAEDIQTYETERQARTDAKLRAQKKKQLASKLVSRVILDDIEMTKVDMLDRLIEKGFTIILQVSSRKYMLSNGKRGAYINKDEREYATIVLESVNRTV